MLVKVYSVPRSKIEEIDIENKDVILEAINIYSKTAFDFVDCILISRKHILGDEIFSFDKKLNNYIKRI